MEEGIRFSLLYLERSTPARDSQRFRNRLAVYYRDNLNDYYKDNTRKVIELETGAKVPWVVMDYSIPEFIMHSELRDVLDSITLIHRVLEVHVAVAVRWKNFVERVFKEENLGYRLDSKCGVHYFVDEEFERNRFSTLSLLDNPQYAGIRAAYEDAYRHMNSDPIDTKAAVRSLFEAIEILVKQIVETKNLNKWIVENTLKERCLPLYTTDKIATKVISEMFDGFAMWVDALHNYRHGQPNEDPVAPTEDMAIYILSSGSAFLRWLIGMDSKLSTRI